MIIVCLALALAACSGGDDDASTATDLEAADSTIPATTLGVETTADDDPVVIDESFLAEQVAKS